jgi:hypothetical protein
LNIFFYPRLLEGDSLQHQFILFSGMKFYHGPLEGVADIIRQNGMTGMYRGFIVQLPRDVIASAIYFTIFDIHIFILQQCE